MSLYSREDPALKVKTYRHSSLMISKLEFMEIADRNVDTYKIGLQHLEEAKKAMSAFSNFRDGMGLADREQTNQQLATVDDGDKFPLRQPLSRRESGRPTDKRKKMDNERGSKRPRFCNVCRSDKHNKKRPNRDQSTDKPRKPPTCSGCGLEGRHSIDRCGMEEQRLADTG